MIVHVVACDYDGTVAEAGQLADDTARLLLRVRETGRKVLLVTGRLLPDLQATCSRVSELFDVVVAENGALLYFPDRREVKLLGEAPEPRLVDALRARDVPLELGSSILATGAGFADAALDAIREVGVERTLVFNRGSLMLLPGGVSKGTGLVQALTALRLSVHNTVGLGDAENDHAFLALCECAVAVADAVPSLRERADLVTRSPGPRGVREFLEGHVLADLAELWPRLGRHQVRLGQDPEGAPVTVPAHGARLLVVGPSGSGKSTITGVLVEGLLEANRGFCLLDPEGNHAILGRLAGVVVLGGQGGQTLPPPAELEQLVRHPGTSLVLNLSGMSRPERIDYAAGALAVIAASARSSGLPHWLLVDEAHHVLARDGAAAVEPIQAGCDSLCLITLAPEDLAPAFLPGMTTVVSTEAAALHRALALVSPELARDPASEAPAPLDQGEALLTRVGQPGPGRLRLRVAERRVPHRRHARKYAEGDLGAKRSFYFRGPRGELNLRAGNLQRFSELAVGVDEGTWSHHRARGDYSAWLRAQVKDDDLADEVAALESAADLGAATSRQRVVEAIRRRYAV